MILEFDFVPNSSPFSLKYVFASNEYSCFVCSIFNDVFAFLITGPNPEAGQPAYKNINIALIPGMQTFVAINSINDGTPGYDPIAGKYYQSSNCMSLNYSNYYVNNGNGNTPELNPTVAYHGFTVPLTANVNVVPNETYHIKFAISDVGDGWYDSAILIEGNDTTTGINELTNINEQINIYPNPANDNLTIDLKGYSIKDKTTIGLYNITGELIKTQFIKSKLTQVNISDLSKGVYIIKVTNDIGVAVKRMVKE